MAADPAALQLRLLQTVVEVAAEKNSTLVMPFPVELLRFLDRATHPANAAPAAAADPAAPAAALPALPPHRHPARTRAQTRACAGRMTTTRVAVDRDAPADGPGTNPRARTRLYRHGTLVSQDFPVADISDHLTDPASVVWLDLCRPTPADFEMIEEEFGLHELAVEDALYVPDLAEHGVAFLLYGLLDHLVDSHFTAVQQFDDGIEHLEDLLFDEHRAQIETVQRRSFQLRKNLVVLRRVVLPMREVLNTLLRRDLDTVGATMAPYYQDVYDHVLRATEWTESLRDLVATIVETNLTVQANRMNLIMKKVTSWAAIIAVPTAITGFYGQNLPYPGYATHWGVLFSTALIAALSALLYLAFKRKDWL
jgi:Mg2+ and Co2+ transporter CorA